MTDLKCLINRCPHTFSYKCIIYNSAVLQQHVVAVWALIVMKMNRFFFFFSLFPASSVGCRREAAAWPCASVSAGICIFMFLLNGLRQFSQQIP